MSNDELSHSALYLTDARDSWWNADYLDLLARRMDLASAKDVLDVGCGKGHFTRAVARLTPHARVTGVDREAEWVEAARASSPPSINFTQGTVQALPFPDASFDLVTCQTVLMHVPDVEAALREMSRVLRPGGRVLAVEPNNLACNLAVLVGAPGFDVEDVLAYVRLEAVCEQGKHALGLGYNSAGERLCFSFQVAGLSDINAWMNDRCHVYLPPHAPAQAALIEEERALFDAGAVIWPEAETRRYYTAGGGDEAAFADLWSRARRAWSTRLSMSYAANEGGLVYIVTGRKR